MNSRYFDKTFYRENGKLVPYDEGVFTLEQINDFYLNDLDLAKTLDSCDGSSTQDAKSALSSNFYEFLSVLFDVAANTAYYDKDGHFGMKLSNDVITQEIDDDLNYAKQVYAEVTDLAQKSNFTFDGEKSVGQQIEDFKNAIYRTLSVECLSAVSSMYDSYSPAV